MPERVRDLPTFIAEIAQLIRLVDQCSAVLFRAGFRQNLRSSMNEASSRLEDLRKYEQLYSPDKFPEMVGAGLAGAQLEMKLESFEYAQKAFEEEANIESLKETLEAGSVILKSITGAIPGFGSFA